MPQRTPSASDPTFSLLLAGDKLLDKRYRPIRRIGKGGYGIVYEVEHAALKKRFALKVLNQQVSRGAEMIRRFRQEALATAKTEHPNIVSVTDFGTTATGQVYLVMELLHGETLLKVLRRDKAVTLSRAIPLLAAACHALDTVHKQGIVHRDLKPANIFLVPQEDIQRGRRKDLVKILDFGLAKVLQESLQERPISQSGKAYGTAGYMAPELLHGAEVTPSVDVYSLGCIAFEMFAGLPVFSGEKPMSLAVAHCNHRAPLVRQRAPQARIPDKLELLIDRCLRKDPKQRVGSCRELLEQLRELTRTLLTSEGTTRVETFGAPSRGGVGDGWRIDTTKQSWWEDFSIPVETPLVLQDRGSSGDVLSPGLDGPTVVDPRLALLADEERQTRDEVVLPAGTPLPEIISEDVTDPRLRADQLQFSAALEPPQHEQPPAAKDPAQHAAVPRAAGPGHSSKARPAPSKSPEPSLAANGGNLTLPVPVLPAPRTTKGTKLLIAALGLATLIVLGAALYLLLTGPDGRGATLVLVVTPAAAEVQFDGRPLPQRGETRVLEEMPTGAHRLEVRHPGCQPAKRQLALRRGKISVARIDLCCE